MAWNLGTTTVRNPTRIREGLTLFSNEFAGNIRGADRERLFWRRLKETGIVDDVNVEAGLEYVPGTTDDMNGRKWRATFKKLGFISGDRFRRFPAATVRFQDLVEENLGLTGVPYEVTPIGRRLIAATTPGAIQDIFLRQLLRLEITSPVEDEGEDFRVKPLVLVLQILDALEARNMKGVNREEIAAFIQTAHDHTGIASRIEAIVAHRLAREQERGRVARSRFDAAARNAAGSGAGIQGDSLRDYADTTFRYLRMSGLFSVEGKRLRLRPERRVAIDKILEVEPVFIAQTDPKQYLVQFYRGGTIPTDDSNTALAIIQRYADLLTQRGIEPRVQAFQLEGRTDHEIEAARHEIQEQYKTEREREYVHSHSTNDETIQDTLEYLKKLGGDDTAEAEIDDDPSFLEWATWRGLLVFNSLRGEPNKTRNFQIDEDMRPVGTAPGGRPDIVMSYPDFLLVAEVTMMRGSRQEAAEGEPVRRHVSDVFTQNADGRDVYGLFVAPVIDLNTTETFRVGTWYRQGVRRQLSIVPIRLETYTSLISSMIARRRTPAELRQLLDECLASRQHEAPEWLESIEDHVETWITGDRPAGNLLATIRSDAQN